MNRTGSSRAIARSAIAIVPFAIATGGTAEAARSVPMSSPEAYGASRDGLSAPIWESPPAGFSPGRNPQSGSGGPFLSISAKASLSTEMRAESMESPDTSLQPQFGCSPSTGADDPHISSTGWAASGHGWWDKGTCSGATAHVTARLYEWYTNGSSGGWVFKAKGGPTSLRPNSAGGGRVTARKDCEAGNLTDWLNVVDVDVDGQADNSDVGERQNDITCRVFS